MLLTTNIIIFNTPKMANRWSNEECMSFIGLSIHLVGQGARCTIMVIGSSLDIAVGVAAGRHGYSLVGLPADSGRTIRTLNPPRGM